jgi:transposase
LIPITVPEVRRLFLALTGSAEQRTFRLQWSLWRRAHQAVAARCHALRRAQGRDRPLVALAAAAATAVPADLTDAEWELVRSLLPPQRPPTGRPRHDHRTLLSGIVWVMRTRSSWRDLPNEFGKWETAYKRYRLWHDTGLWQRLLAVLGDDADRESR